MPNTIAHYKMDFHYSITLHYTFHYAPIDFYLFIKTLNNHNNDFSKENITIKQGETPFDIKEGKPSTDQ